MEDCFHNLGLRINGIIHLSPKEAWEAQQKGAVIVDVREEKEIEYKAFDVGNILFYPFSNFPAGFLSLPKDIPLIIAGGYGMRSKMVVEELVKKGYSNVANLNGGILEWERDGLPFKKQKGAEQNGPCPCQLRPLRISDEK